MRRSRKRKGSRRRRRTRSSSSSSETTEHSSSRSRSRSSGQKQKRSRHRRRTREPSVASSSSSETTEHSSSRSRSRSSCQKQKRSRHRRRTREPSAASSSSSETTEHSSRRSRSRSSGQKQKRSRHRRRTREPSAAPSSSSETTERHSSRSSGQKRKRRTTKRRRKDENTKRQQGAVASKAASADDVHLATLKFHTNTKANELEISINKCFKYSYKHHVDQQPEPKCETCNLNFTTLSAFYLHMSRHEKKKFSCEQCDKSYFHRSNLWRHVNQKHSVKSPEEISAAPEKTGVMKENLTETLKVSVTTYNCRCGKTEYTYDASVRHAQVHLVEAQIRENGTQCEPEFDNRHEEGDHNNRSLIKMNFDYRKLLTDSWFDMFKRTELSSSICSSSLYKYTRSVKLNWDSEKRNDGEGQCVPLYKCGACNLFVEPTNVQDHCEIYYKSNVCVALKPQGHRCPECQKCFYTLNALNLHKEDHEAHKNLRARIVTFNDKGDEQFNKALKQMSLVSVEDTQSKKQQEISRNTETTVLQKNSNVQQTSQDNVAKPVSQYCAQCRRYYSDSNKHNAYHENERKRIMDAFLRGQQQSSSADTAESATKKCNNKNAEKEEEDEGNVSRNENTRRDSAITGSTVQAHNKNTAEASKDDDVTREGKDVVVEWGDSDSDTDDSNPTQLNLKAIVKKQDEVMQKTYNDNINSDKNTLGNSKLHGSRKNNNDVVEEGKVDEEDQYDQLESTVGKLLGESNNPINTLEEYNESQSTEDLQRVLEGDTELTLQAPREIYSLGVLWVCPPNTRFHH